LYPQSCLGDRMPSVSEILVEQTNITNVSLSSRASAVLVDGQVRLKVQSFALTANNVTYAATGFQIGYWKFFPSATPDMGIVPVWGHCVVAESKSDCLSIGTRLYGFLPMAEDLVITPQATRGRSVVDVSAHRHGLPAVYNIYTIMRETSQEADYFQALLQPLIATSFVLFDWLQDNDWFGARQIIIGSASSKTGLGLCKFLAEQTGRPYRVIGLTSERNLSFVTGLNACDQVLGYDQIDQIERETSVYIDMSGNAAVKVRLHDRLSDKLAHSSAVGISHWDKFEQGLKLKGPKPQFFFAPAQIAKRKEDWGPGVVERKIAEASARITQEAPDWMNLKCHNGLDAAIAVFQDIAAGKSRPDEGHVIVL